MSENNTNNTNPAENENLPAETASAAGNDIPEEEDSGIIFIPDDGPSDVDAQEEQQKLYEEIEQRKSNITEYVPPEMTFAQKASNFWYRNKPLIIVAVFAVLVAAYLIFVSIPEKYDGDVTLYVSSSDYRVSITYEIQHELEKYADDIDENGETLLKISDFNSAGENGFIVMANYVLMVDHLNGEPLSMLWVVDKELYDMMVAGYGEDIFESYEGAPLWIELTTNEIINTSIELGESPRLGICLRRMTDEFRENEALCQSYENALSLLANMKEAHPEMFEPAEETEAE